MSTEESSEKRLECRDCGAITGCYTDDDHRCDLDEVRRRAVEAYKRSGYVGGDPITYKDAAQIIVDGLPKIGWRGAPTYNEQAAELADAPYESQIGLIAMALAAAHEAGFREASENKACWCQ